MRMSSYTVDLATMQVTSKHDYQTYTAGYEQGYADGTLNGLATADRELAAAWVPMREFHRKQANKPSYEELAERRGEAERAARQREILTERGLA